MTNESARQRLDRIIETLGITEDALSRLRPEVSPKEVPSKEVSWKDVGELVDCFLAIEPDRRHLVLELARDLGRRSP